MPTRCRGVVCGGASPSATDCTGTAAMPPPPLVPIPTGCVTAGCGVWTGVLAGAIATVGVVCAACVGVLTGATGCVTAGGGVCGVCGVCAVCTGVLTGAIATVGAADPPRPTTTVGVAVGGAICVCAVAAPVDCDGVATLSLPPPPPQAPSKAVTDIVKDKKISRILVIEAAP